MKEREGERVRKRRERTRKRRERARKRKEREGTRVKVEVLEELIRENETSIYTSQTKSLDTRLGNTRH